MCACDSSREFNLITNVLPLLRHIGRHTGIQFERGFAYETPAKIVVALEMLVGERAVVKEIENFGDF
jgi:hypothetical protein